MTAPDFDFWERPALRDLICRHYWLKHYEVPALSSSTLFESRLPVKHTIFNYPFAITSGGNDPLVAAFDTLVEHSKQIGRPIIVKSLSDDASLPRQLAAYNPMVELGNARAAYRPKFRSQLRRHARELDNLNIKISRTQDARDFELFYDTLFARTYQKKHRMITQPRRMLRELIAIDGSSMYLARNGDTIVGGIICTASSTVLHYNWGAMSPDINLSVGGLILDKAILDAEEAGLSFFDLGATPLSHESLLQFKTRFGAAVMPVYYYYTGQLPNVVDYNSSFPLLKALIPHIPLPILKLLPPMALPILVN